MLFAAIAKRKGEESIHFWPPASEVSSWWGRREWLWAIGNFVSSVGVIECNIDKEKRVE